MRVDFCAISVDLAEFRAIEFISSCRALHEI